MSKEHKGIYFPPCKDDYLVAITVIEYKMRVLSNKFRSDDGGWSNEVAYVKWAKLKDAKNLLRR